MEKHLAECFHEYFEMVPADTDELITAAYRLRYEIFCKELGALDPNLYPDGLEKDKYDEHSRHYLIRHRKTGVLAATSRLILLDTNDPGMLFPTESKLIIKRKDIIDNIPRNQLAEVSRFCISKYFRRRLGEDSSIIGVDPFSILHNYVACEAERRAWPTLLLGLITSLNKLNLDIGTTHWLSMLEPSVFRLYRNLGIHFTPLGPLSECYGNKRMPCIIKVPDYLDSVKQKNLEAWEFLTDYGRYLGLNTSQETCDSV